MPGRRNGDMSKFARRLRELRKQMNWSRQALATQMNVTATTVGNWENAKCFPQLGARGDLCNLFGTDAEDLFLPPYNT